MPMRMVILALPKRAYLPIASWVETLPSADSASSTGNMPMARLRATEPALT